MGATSQEGVQEVGVLLLHGGDDPASPAGQRLTALMSAYSQVGATHPAVWFHTLLLTAGVYLHTAGHLMLKFESWYFLLLLLVCSVDPV